jgi:mannose-6-phosphate isomerase
MTTPYPLLMEPIFKHRIWGGRELERLGKDLPDGEVIGESWEVADLPDTIEEGRNRILNGPLTGHTLRDLIEGEREMLLGLAQPAVDGGFPLLVKYLDARQNLSVQVHPTPEYVETHPEAYLKSEAWIVIDAEPGAMIYKGVRPAVTPEEFAVHIRTNEVVDDLISVPVQTGDCHYLPSGTCHALGAGIIVAEIQTPSDTTFRVYDWGRTGRELHVDEALECIRFGVAPEEASPAMPIETMSFRTTPLVETDYFTIERIEAREAAELPVVTDDLPVIWMMIAGRGTLAGGGEQLDLSTGATIVLPAKLEDAAARLEPGCTLLHVTLPHPTRGMIA